MNNDVPFKAYKMFIVALGWCCNAPRVTLDFWNKSGCLRLSPSLR